MYFNTNQTAVKELFLHKINKVYIRKKIKGLKESQVIWGITYMVYKLIIASPVVIIMDSCRVTLWGLIWHLHMHKTKTETCI